MQKSERRVTIEIYIDLIFCLISSLILFLSLVHGIIKPQYYQIKTDSQDQFSTDSLCRFIMTMEQPFSKDYNVEKLVMQLL